MTPFNPEQDERVPPIYGDSAMYIEPPVGDNQRNGVVPLDTLPAQWWNWLWNNVTKYCNAVVNPEIHDIVDELTNVLSAAGMTPDSVNQDQLLRAIRKIVDDTTATTSQKGVVKASNTNGKVSVDSDGIMTANGLGDIAQLTTVIKTSVVNALNEVVSNVGTLSSLSTTAKTDLVSAINELVTAIGAIPGQKQADWTQTTTTAVDYIKNKPNLATVATSGSYSDLSGKPTIPAAQVNSDWNASSGVAQILNKPTIPTDYPPKDHASTAATYGKATSTKYGHVKASGMINIGEYFYDDGGSTGTVSVTRTCPAGGIVGGRISYTHPSGPYTPKASITVPGAIVVANFNSGQTLIGYGSVGASMTSGDSGNIHWLAISTTKVSVGV